MSYLKIRNWDKWQSYRKDRGQPPWIKIHRSLLRDHDWVMLNDAQRGQLVAMWMLAADKDGNIPKDPVVIQRVCCMMDPPDIELFISYGFIEDDASVTSGRRQDDRTDTDTEAETETDKTLMSSQQVETDSKSSPVKVPYNKIVDLYHRVLPDHPRVKVLTAARKSAIKQRHLKDMDKSLEEWESYFNMIGRSDFLCGKTQPTCGKKVFLADLEWITKEGNFVKIYEGKYHG